MSRLYGSLTAQILMALQGEALTCGQLAQRVEADHQVVSVTVNRLRKQGWVRPSGVARQSTKRWCVRYTAHPNRGKQ